MWIAGVKSTVRNRTGNCCSSYSILRLEYRSGGYHILLPSLCFEASLLSLHSLVIRAKTFLPMLTGQNRAPVRDSCQEFCCRSLFLSSLYLPEPPGLSSRPACPRLSPARPKAVGARGAALRIPYVLIYVCTFAGHQVLNLNVST